jgi:hypothetical protein
MKTFLCSLCAVLYACAATGQAPIVTTVVNAVPGTTNFVDIPAGQAARVSAIKPGDSPQGYDERGVSFEKDGFVFSAAIGDVVQGPARFGLRGLTNSIGASALVTLERWPLVDPEKILALPQGTNAVAVSMQTSTDLQKWEATTNGVYRTTDGPKFFRLKAEK